MRITGGAARSIQLKTLDLPQLRPATDQMRQAIFNSLGDSIVGARFLDLFAGCGAYGLEAFSRGASGGVFIEKEPRLKKIIETNLAAVAKSAQRPATDCSVRSSDALKYLPAPTHSFQIVFCDPPYSLIEEYFSAMGEVASTALAFGGLWLLEHPAYMKLPLPPGFQLIKNLGGKSPHTPNVAMYQKQ